MDMKMAQARISWIFKYSVDHQCTVSTSGIQNQGQIWPHLLRGAGIPEGVHF